MDRKEKPQTASDYANQREVSEGTARTLPGPGGREDDSGAEPGRWSSEDVKQPIGAQPRSAVTGRHDSGSGANETADGLNATEEMTRAAAEDVPLDPDADADEEPTEDTPVFDRASEIGLR
jgi:hypothetical protein